MILKHAGSLILMLLLLGCSGTMDDYASAYYNPETRQFEHPDGNQHDKNFLDLLQFASSYFTREDDEWERTGFPVIKTPADRLAGFSESLIWVGQSTLLVNHGEMTILTDPHFSGRASPFESLGPKRVTPPPFTVADLPRIDIVVISHNHYDHLDEKTIRQLAELQPDIKFLVPLGLGSTLREWGGNDVTELDWWQAVVIDGVDIQPTPLRHWSKRSSFDRNKTLWAGWSFRWPDFSFYFAGDTGYSDDFKETARRLGSPTLAALPIGAYAPRAFMKSAHMNPEEAVTAFQDLGATYAVGIHWGTFKLTLEQMNEPPIRLAKVLHNAGVAKDAFRALQHGEHWPQPFQ